MPIQIIENKISHNKSLRWINITNAKKNEIKYLKDNFNFTLKNLRDSLSHVRSQRLIIEEHSNYLFLIFHFPVFNKEKNEIIGKEIDCFISKNYLITVHNNKNKSLNSLFNLCRKDQDTRDNYMGKDPLFLFYEILNRTFDQCFFILDMLNIKISEVEEKIFSSRQRESIDDILMLKHNIINFSRIMQSHKNTLKKIFQCNNKKIFSSCQIKTYNKLIRTTKDIWEIAQSQKEMIEALEYTNDSMLSYKMGNIMKTLTIFSVIVFPLTLFAAIFGMNTMNGMPFIQNKNGFWIIISVMVAGTILMFLIFKKKKWL
ncbi:MAG: magnesium transporter CorA family protein [Patescibacteria group bacterium]|nr:magnesium transporter CorA family protein [Patescibacteria group bacterium]